MQHYLWILKTTHSGADMDVALEMAKGSLDADLQWNLHDLLSHREDWWVPGKLVELRQRLQGYREVGLGPRLPTHGCCRGRLSCVQGKEGLVMHGMCGLLSRLEAMGELGKLESGWQCLQDSREASQSPDQVVGLR